MSGWGLGPWLAAADWRRRTEEDRRRRQGERYDREIRAALARGWLLTAEAIEAERVEWAAGVAGVDGDGR